MWEIIVVFVVVVFIVFIFCLGVICEYERFYFFGCFIVVVFVVCYFMIVEYEYYRVGVFFVRSYRFDYVFDILIIFF